jgi:endonuclease/exonuclease/phosphatase family metal-dependent hydrolase
MPISTLTAQFRLLVACIALVACASAPRAIPSSTVRSVPSTTLRVMTYNIHAGHGDIDRTAATIRAFSPEIVGVEEVDVHWAERSGFVHGTRVRVFVTHLDYRKDPSVRRTQVAEMLARIGAVDSPTLLLGDMNASPDAAEIQPLFARMRDSWLTTAGPGFTYPADTPTERIDYVFVSPNAKVDTAFVPVVPAASDHRPVVVDLSFGRN